MKLDKNLNLVMRLSDSKGDFVVHSMPLPTEVFSANFKIFRTAYEEMTSGGIKSAIMLATYILRDAGEEHNRVAQVKDVIDTIANATTIIRGNSILLNHSDLDEDVKEEVLNRLVFFTVWEFFVLPTEKEEFWNAISLAMDLERKSVTVSDLLSSSTTPSDNSQTISQEKELTTKPAQSSPI